MALGKCGIGDELWGFLIGLLRLDNVFYSHMLTHSAEIYASSGISLKQLRALTFESIEDVKCCHEQVRL